MTKLSRLYVFLALFPAIEQVNDAWYEVQNKVKQDKRNIKEPLKLRLNQLS